MVRLNTHRIKNYVGQDTFQYRISDGELLSDPVTVTFTIESTATINTPPVIVTADLSLAPQSIHEVKRRRSMRSLLIRIRNRIRCISIGRWQHTTVINLAAGVTSIPATQHVYQINPSADRLIRSRDGQRRSGERGGFDEYHRVEFSSISGAGRGDEG